MPNEVKLLPCPFCEGHGGIFQDDGDFYVCCTGCWSKSPLKEHKDEAIAAWNTRPTIVTDEVVERVARVLAECSIRRRSHWQDGDQRLIAIAVNQNWQDFKGDSRKAIAAMPAIVGGE